MFLELLLVDFVGWSYFCFVLGVDIGVFSYLYYREFGGSVRGYGRCFVFRVGVFVLLYFLGFFGV